MSNSLAAAKKRRAPASMSPTPTIQQEAINRGNSQPMSNPGLTLPQVIALVDKRLVALETGMRNWNESDKVDRSEVDVPSNLTEVLDEFNGRFDTLAEEIGNLKSIVLSLQSYTMDVNKLLLDERMRILKGGDSETNLETFANLPI